MKLMRLFSVFLLGAFISATASAGDSTTVSLTNGKYNKDSSYEIKLKSVNGKVWTYEVDKKKGHGLSHWVLGLSKECSVKSANPSHDGLQVDPSVRNIDGIEFYGMKWNSSGGTFKITFNKEYSKKNIPVLAKASNGYGEGSISGPDCGVEEDELIDVVCYQGTEYEDIKRSLFEQYENQGATEGKCPEVEDDSKDDDEADEPAPNSKLTVCYKDENKEIKYKDLDKYLNEKGATEGECAEKEDDSKDDDANDETDPNSKLTVCYKDKNKEIKYKDLDKYLNEKGATEGECAEKEDDSKNDDANDETDPNSKLTVCYNDKDKEIKYKDLDKYLNEKGATEGECADDDSDKKITICHNGKTQEVAQSAWDGHEGHGDTLGECGDKEDDDNDNNNDDEANDETTPDQLVLTGALRDFKDSHPDFEGSVTGLKKACVQNTLGSNGLPVAKNNNACKATKLNQWFTDIEGVNKSTRHSITLKRIKEENGLAVYRYENTSFFPIDNKLFGNQNRSHNYHFTYMLKTNFVFKKGMKFNFSGDDDVWVYINKKLAVDLGGVHGKATQNLSSSDLEKLGLQEGNTYELKFFFAERHTTQSNFILETSLVLEDEEPAGKVDLWVADPTPDDGSEPSKARKIWVSPDVWVRNNDDGQTRHQNVVGGKNNFVNVRVSNIGELDAEDTTVEVYWVKPSLGSAWPTRWTKIGTSQISSLAAGENTSVSIKWPKNKIPNPGHYCFHVRVLNEADPIPAAAQTRHAINNTKLSNNVAWRNFNVAGMTKKATDNFTVNAENPNDAPANVDFVIEVEGDLVGEDGAAIIVDLGDLFDRWQAAGGKGKGVEPVGGTKVKITAKDVELNDIPMQAEEQAPITIGLELFEPLPGAGATVTVNLSVQEIVDGELAGGVDFEITARGQDADTDKDGIPDVTDPDDDNDGMPDAWEVENGLLPLQADADADADNDGQSNKDEFDVGTDPQTANDTPLVDLWIKDPNPDDGSQPSKAKKIWRSPDVWVRNAEDAQTRHQNVKGGQDNYVYVNVQNIGNLTATDSKVELYFTKPSLGSAWPNRWTKIGEMSVAELPADGKATLAFLWEEESIPNPGHYCFHVRVHNDADPIPVAAQSRNAVRNTKASNNIAWRNFNVLGMTNKTTDTFTVNTQNPKDAPALIDLIIEAEACAVGQDGIEVTADLGELFARWQAAGGNGENIEAIAGSTKVKLTGAPAKISGLNMEVDADYPINVDLQILEPMPVDALTVTCGLSIQQMVDGEEDGGVDFEITARGEQADSDGDGDPDVTDPDDDNDGMPDAWEVENGLLPLQDDSRDDSDNDGTPNGEEFTNGTDPNIADVPEIIDVWVKDPRPDDGTEPTLARKIWMSPDIWIRNDQDGGLKHQNVKGNQDNFAYINVRNLGNTVAKDTKVELYFTKPSLGTRWPDRWTPIGEYSVAELGIGEVETVAIKWAKEQIPGKGHYCFHVRLINADDPIPANAQTRNAVNNTKRSNNIAWRNFNVLGLKDKTKDKFTVHTQNPKDEPATIDYLVEVENCPVTDNAIEATVDLGALFSVWQQAGGNGENLTVIDGTTKVKITGTPAKVIGVPMAGNGDFPLDIEVQALEPMPIDADSVECNMSIQQIVDGEEDGGVDFTIITRGEQTDTDGDGDPDVTDPDDDNDGMPDAWETENGLLPLQDDSRDDSDNDGTPNGEEFTNGTDPNVGNPPVDTGPEWADGFSGEHVAWGEMGNGSGTSYFGETLWTNDSICTLAQENVLNKPWYEPQWVKARGHIVLFAEENGQWVQGGELKMKLSLGWYIVHPKNSRNLTGETIICPTVMPDGVELPIECADGPDNKHDAGHYLTSNQVLTSDENGVIEFETYSWWTGVPEGYRDALNLVTIDGSSDWTGRTEYLVENHYSGTLRGGVEGQEYLLANLDFAGQQRGIGRSVAWNAAWSQQGCDLPEDETDDGTQGEGDETDEGTEDNSAGNGGNAACPAGSEMLVKFEWNGSRYVLEGENTAGVILRGTTIEQIANATGGQWTSAVPMAYLVLKGANDNHAYDLQGAKAGSFSKDVLEGNGNGGSPDISNMKFCGDPDAPKDFDDLAVENIEVISSVRVWSLITSALVCEGSTCDPALLNSFDPMNSPDGADFLLELEVSDAQGLPLRYEYMYLDEDAH
ncbi:fibro-slime domain-containing protein [Candidatus Albibeggiatoa sp. nov. BB20]|uniref:fibro-slime domain-containing protein n=1 Tax=Candidatus Albibeggiatoa sp. nov. BB20 TaxID=3162723 RepID=UPI00336599E2